MMETTTSPMARIRGHISTMPWRVRVCAGFLILLVLAALVTLVISPHDPNATNLSNRLEAPGAEHWFGTDALGRDVFSRVLAGTRVALMIALVAGGFGAVIGVSLALLSGYFGGRTDSIIMGWVEAQTSLPFIVLAITVASILGPNLRNLIIALVVTGWVFYARVVRAEVMSVSTREYIAAAKVGGQRHGSIMLREVMPNVAGAVAVITTQEVPRLILTAAALSFLGLGVQPPTADWGNMIAEGKSYVVVAWWLTVVPGLFIVAFAVAFSTIGDWLRDLFDPQSDAV
ncbi:MAG TPA: ABC transporter permease [Candidatus Stackebrandtia excrementipullorum]|nr:ABC transporter permease [Candidatus Stackebrandtia excrementipullorum]